MRRDDYFRLLKSWCDAMMAHQLKGTGNKAFDGGILCPACKTIHGRCHDGVYPLLYMADATGETKYLESALALFDWGENMICDDGSLYNDAHSAWNGITVFTVIGLYDALEKHGHLLPDEQRKRMEQRMRMGAEWVYQNITMSFRTNINYHATAAAALALVGNYDDREDYRERAGKLAQSCLEHIVEGQGYLYGEGQPMEEQTKRGCRPVDIGYNAEESLPSLLTYARAAKDEKALLLVKKVLKEQLHFMLPDGAWDNSFGSRNFKWTYWGSRTSDGCQSAYGSWGKEEPLFAEAAWRNLKLYENCTKDGLLYGGPDYYVHGELPCIHHTFCHANSLAAALDSGIEETETVALPTETDAGLRHYPEIDLYRVAQGDFLADVTGYDFEYVKGGHTYGGCLSLLWHQKLGPICISSMTEYSTPESNNMQLSLRKASQGILTPRLECVRDGVRFSQCFDKDAVIEAGETDKAIQIVVRTHLKNKDGAVYASGSVSTLTYTFTDRELRITGHTDDLAARFLFPVIGREKDGMERDGKQVNIPKAAGMIHVECSQLETKIPSIFCLAGGFEAWQLSVKPDEHGEFYLKLRADS